MEELVSAALFLDRQHPGARVIVITGAGSKAFAAGADIKEMVGADYAEVGRHVWGGMLKVEGDVHICV
jgi:enoyl-CoA hydratase